MLPAHSLRPQLFHFDPIEAEQAAASTTAFSRENHLTAMGGGAAKSGRGMSSIGVGIVGRPVPRLEQQGGFRSGEVFGQSVEGNTNNSMGMLQTTSISRAVNMSDYRAAPDRRAQLSAHKRSANLSANNLPGPSGDQFSSRGFGVPHHQEGGGIKNLFPNFF